MRRLLLVLTAFAAAACATDHAEPEPASPFVGEFDVAIRFTSNTHLTTCTLNDNPPYCYATDSIDEAGTARIVVPPEPRDHLGWFTGVSITVNGVVYPACKAGPEPNYEFSAGGGMTPGSKLNVLLRGSFSGDSVVGTIRWSDGSSIHTGVIVGSFVARRK